MLLVVTLCLASVLVLTSCAEKPTAPKLNVEPKSNAESIKPQAAPAAVWYPAPPTCHTDSRWIQWKPGYWAYYEFAYEYRRQIYGPCVGGRGLYQRVFVYHVQYLFYPYGLVSTGRAEKVCGTICG